MSVDFEPRSRPQWSTSEVDHAHLDGCGAAKLGRDTNARRCCATSAATADRARYHHELERHGEDLASYIPQQTQGCAC